MSLFLTDDDLALVDELNRSWAGAAARAIAPGRVTVETDIPRLAEAPPPAFARQLLPGVVPLAESSIAAWAKAVVDSAAGVLPDEAPWRLHIVAQYGLEDRRAGLRRCELIRAAIKKLLRDRRRRLLRSLRDDEGPFTPADSLVQMLLSSPETGWLSVAAAPLPHVLRRTMWPFPKGEVFVAVDKSAPSRAFAKLLEAEMRLGVRIAPNETCIDLGAAPGSWSYVALKRGARVTAVDRSPLREDLMPHPQLRFIRGDAFAFIPTQPVDWLLCDVIAAPRRSSELLLEWLRRRWARRFVVTVKFKGRQDYAQLERLKSELPKLAAEWYLVRLCANKNEVCGFGVADSGAQETTLPPPNGIGVNP
jgi:23S rRNA (cytidine2498-2'-O)-methyltransferase